MTVAPLILNGVPYSIDYTFVLRSTDPIVWAEDRSSGAYAMRRVDSDGGYVIGDAAMPTDKARAYMWHDLTAGILASLKTDTTSLIVEHVESVRRDRYADAANLDADRLAAMAGELRRRVTRLGR